MNATRTMHDKSITPVGIIGTILTFTLGEINAIIGITVGVLSAIYVGLGIVKRWKNLDK